VIRRPLGARGELSGGAILAGAVAIAAVVFFLLRRLQRGGAPTS
jgi:hypothetical protein